MLSQVQAKNKAAVVVLLAVDLESAMASAVIKKLVSVDIELQNKTITLV